MYRYLEYHNHGLIKQAGVWVDFIRHSMDSHIDIYVCKNVVRPNKSNGTCKPGTGPSSKLKQAGGLTFIWHLPFPQRNGTLSWLKFGAWGSEEKHHPKSA